MSLIAVKCPSCGADIQLDDSREFGFCNFCGTKVIQDKVVVEHKGNVTIDNSEAINNLKILAQRAKESNDYLSAAKYYSQILQSSPNDWKAQFYSVYFECLGSGRNNISDSSERLAFVASNTLKMISQMNINLEEKKQNVEEIADCVVFVANNFYNKCMSLLNSSGNGNGAEYNAGENCGYIILMTNGVAGEIIELFSNEKSIESLACKILKEENQILVKLMNKYPLKGSYFYQMWLRNTHVIRCYEVNYGVEYEQNHEKQKKKTVITASIISLAVSSVVLAVMLPLMDLFFDIF